MSCKSSHEIRYCIMGSSKMIVDNDTSALLASNKTVEKNARSPIARILTSGVLFWALIALTTIAAIRFGALSENRNFFDRDEKIYMRVTKLFGNEISAELLRSYNGEPASPAPVFFIVYSAWGKLFGFTYPALRTLSLVITLLTMLCLWLYLRRFEADEGKDFFPVLVFIFPYIFCMGFSLMAEPLTLLLTVIGLCCCLSGLRRNSDVLLLIGSIAIAAALYVRIHAVFVCPALMATLIIQRNRSIRKWFLAVLPILLRLPLLFWQGGLTVSREAFPGTKPEFGLCISNINFSLVWFGYMFFPLLWWARTRRWINFLAVLALIPFYFLVCPDFLGTEHNGALRSIFLRLGANPTQIKWILFPAWIIGCYITVELIQRFLSKKDISEAFLCACIVMYFAQLIFSTVAFERYYLLAVPAIILLGVKRTTRSGGYITIAGWHFLFLALTFIRLLKDLV